MWWHILHRSLCRSRSLVDQARMCGIMEEANANTSDHLLVFAVISIYFENNNKIYAKRYNLAKHKRDIYLIQVH